MLWCKLELTIQFDKGTVGGGAIVAVRFVNSVVRLIGRGVCLVSPNFSACLLDRRMLVLLVSWVVRFIWFPVFQS